MKLTFLGAAGEVTGSSYLVETGAARFIVDCGMFQGGHDAGHKNRARFGFDPDALDFVLLTHAHIDHSGLLPRLAAEGFKGPVYATGATCDLLEPMLIDSANIQEHDARSGDTAAPLYTAAHARRALRLLRPVDYGAALAPHAGVRCVFHDAGHILGSSIIEVSVEGAESRKLVFSGDLGQPARPIVRDPETIASADVLLVESTYGNRLHKSLAETVKELEHALVETITHKGGNVIVPAFAVGRTQDLIYLIAELHRAGRLPKLDVYVDSPMAMKATEITLEHVGIVDKEAVALIRWMREHQEGPLIRFVEDIEESIELHRVKRGAVIIAASGMCEAGRIQFHLRHNLPRPECSVLITGYQATGTLGRQLVNGAKEVRLMDMSIPVRASVHTIGGLSAHADQKSLLGWLGRFERPPRRTFVIHGEGEAATHLAGEIRRRLGWRDVAVPQARECVEV